MQVVGNTVWLGVSQRVKVMSWNFTVLVDWSVCSLYSAGCAFISPADIHDRSK